MMNDIGAYIAHLQSSMRFTIRIMLVDRKETVESFHGSDKKEVYIKNNFGAQLLFMNSGRD